jgi:hypothetical protein
MADYEVGYNKPPRHSQFKPGNCANPHGRGYGLMNWQLGYTSPADLTEFCRQFYWNTISKTAIRYLNVTSSG